MVCQVLMSGIRTETQRLYIVIDRDSTESFQIELFLDLRRLHGTDVLARHTRLFPRMRITFVVHVARRSVRHVHVSAPLRTRNMSKGNQLVPARYV